jgi:carboxyl-terminal processing protease
MKRSLYTLPLLILVAIVAALLLRGRNESVASVNSTLEGLRKIEGLLHLIRDAYVEDMDYNAVTEGAITGLLDKLDPHSAYIPAAELQEITEDFKGQFEGIGIYFVIRDKQLTVVSAIPGTPSDRLGISPGDIITEIEGKNTWGITNDEVQKKLKGPRGTEVKIRIRRPGLSEPLDFTIVREQIPIISVDNAFMLKPGLGYIRLNRFMATSAEEVETALEKLKAEGMRELIFDLRNNSGGLMDQAAKIVDLFLPGQEVIVSTRGRIPRFNSELTSTGRAPYADLPLVILINQGSASASEIVAGAIQDHDRGLVAGRTSFGKGLVQRQFDFGDSTSVRLTIARYYTPSGRLIQRAYDKSLAEYYAEAFDDVDPNMDADSTADKPVFQTRAGRTVYGGGGITPDVQIRSGRLSVYTSRLRTLRMFFAFANDRVTTGPLRSQLEAMGQDQFLSSWEADPALLEEFLGFVDEQDKKDELVFKDADWRRDLHWVKGYIKREFARVLWGQEAALKADAGMDPALTEAELLFDEARRIQKLSASR